MISNKQIEIAHADYIFYRKRFRMIQKVLINKDNDLKTLKLTKIYKMEKNAFWKIIKKHKNRNRSFTKNKIRLCEFEKFYTYLFSHDDMEDKEEHVKINEEVNKYYSELKEKTFDVNICENLIEKCLKELKNNKAVGNDMICNEMYKNPKCEKLNRLLKEIFNDIINQGMVLNNFNISLISPIEKKSNGNKLLMIIERFQSQTLLQTYIKHVGQLLKICSNYAEKWKLVIVR